CSPSGRLRDTTVRVDADCAAGFDTRPGARAQRDATTHLVGALSRLCGTLARAQPARRQSKRGGSSGEHAARGTRPRAAKRARPAVPRRFLAGEQPGGYDGFLQTTTIFSGPVAGTVTMTYDNDFRVATKTVNARAAIGFGYDSDSLLTTVGAMTRTRQFATG